MIQETKYKQQTCASAPSINKYQCALCRINSSNKSNTMGLSESEKNKKPKPMRTYNNIRIAPSEDPSTKLFEKFMRVAGAGIALLGLLYLTGAIN